jgi:hypothetical protein
MRESRLAASIDHPNVIPIYQAGEDDGQLYLTMRFVEGTDLAEVLDHDRRLEPERAVAITAQVAAALDAAHARGLVHRDVKPANVLIEERAEGEHVFLTDFGLTKQARSDTRLTETGALLGTVDYIAPEQLQGEDVDPRTDVYALGCVLYQMLSGRVPFEKPNQMAKLFAHASEEPPPLDGVPPELAAVVHRAMEKDPGMRFYTAGDLANAAAEAIGMRAPVMAPSRPRRRHPVPWKWLAGGAAALVAVAIAAVVVAVLASSGGGGKAAAEKPAVMALLRRAHRGFTVAFCRNDLTTHARDTYFAPRHGNEALIACENLGGGPPNRKPLSVGKITIQGHSASAQIDVDDQPTTFYMLKRDGRWRIDDFTETKAGRYQREVGAAIQPSFRITDAVNRFVVGKLPLVQADGVPAEAVPYLRVVVKQLEAVSPPAGVRDIHTRLLEAMRAQLTGAEEALAAQKAGDEKAWAHAGEQIFASVQQLGAALDDLSRAQ